MLKILCFILCSILLSPYAKFAQTLSSTTSFALEEETILAQLLPYQTVIDQINQNYNATITIPAGSRFGVYQNVKDISLDIFEAQLRNEYQKAKVANQMVILGANDTITPCYTKQPEETVAIIPIDEVRVTSPSETRVTSYLIQNENKENSNWIGGATTLNYLSNQEILQTYRWDLGCVAMLSVSENIQATFQYTNIKEVAYFSMKNQVHFRSSETPSVTLLDDNQTCKVSYHGFLYSGYGINLSIPINVTAYYHSS